jgi:tetratricopeptide (TPR) repeat protein
MDPTEIRTHASAVELALIETARAATVHDTRDVSAWIRLGRLLFEPGHRHDDAIAALNSALAIDRMNAEARFWLAVVYFQDFAESAAARPLLEEAVSLEPNNPAYLTLMASVRRDLGEAGPETLELIRRAVALAPDWRASREQLVVELLDSGQRSEAVAALSALDELPVIDSPADPAEGYYEEVVTGRSRKSHQAWIEYVDRRLAEPRQTRIVS